MSEQDFLAAQAIRAERADTDGENRVYRLSGRLHCGLCGRRMDSHRVHDRLAYRCQHGHTSSRTRPVDAPGNLYLREDHVLARIAEHLAVAGVATDPTPEETARLVSELDLAFRCDTTSITLLEPRAAASRTRSTRGRVAGPTTRPVDLDPVGLDPVEADELGDDTDSGQLMLDLCFGSEPAALADSSEQVDRLVAPSRGSGSAPRQGRRTRPRRRHEGRSTRPSRSGRASAALATARRVHVAWPGVHHRHPLVDEHMTLRTCTQGERADVEPGHGTGPLQAGDRASPGGHQSAPT